jgi:hypothetical protein
VRQSPTSENVSSEAEDIVEIHYRATTAIDTANWEDLVCPIVTYSVDLWNGYGYLQLQVTSVQQIQFPIQTPYLVIKIVTI